VVDVRTKRSRSSERLIEIAAKELLRWKVDDAAWAEDPAQKEKLASIVSGQISSMKDPNLRAYRKQVQANWVTRNRAKIETRRSELAVQCTS
jgi:hypothetical protein